MLEKLQCKTGLLKSSPHLLFILTLSLDDILADLTRNGWKNKVQKYKEGGRGIRIEMCPRKMMDKVKSK